MPIKCFNVFEGATLFLETLIMLEETVFFEDSTSDLTLGPGMSITFSVLMRSLQWFSSLKSTNPKAAFTMILELGLSDTWQLSRTKTTKGFGLRWDSSGKFRAMTSSRKSFQRHFYCSKNILWANMSSGLRRDMNVGCDKLGDCRAEGISQLLHGKIL